MIFGAWNVTSTVKSSPNAYKFNFSRDLFTNFWVNISWGNSSAILNAYAYLWSESVPFTFFYFLKKNIFRIVFHAQLHLNLLQDFTRK